MPARNSPVTPPPGFVPVSPGTWGELCERVGQSPKVLELKRANTLIGWRSWLKWYVDPAAYREVMGTWPPGYWPEP